MIVCTRCGFKNEDEDSDFCSSCGRFLEWTGKRVEAVQAAPLDDPEEEYDASGRRTFKSRVEGFIYRSPGAAPPGTAPVDTLPPQAAAPGSALQAPPVAPYGADPQMSGAVLAPPPPGAPAVGPQLPSAPAPPGGEPAPPPPGVFGPFLPPAEQTAPAPAPAADAADAANGGSAVEPAPARDPRLAALIASPVNVVPDLEPETRPTRPSAFDPNAANGSPANLGGTPARQPGMVRKPELFRPAAQAASEQSVPQRIVRPGDIECPQCHQGNYPWRTFCRACGRPLDHKKSAAERQGPWQWLWGTLSAPVHRRRDMVRAGSRPGHKYHQSQGAQRDKRDKSEKRKFQMPHLKKKISKKWLAVIGILLILFFTFGPFKKGFRRDYESAKNYVLGAITPSFVQQFPVQVSASNQMAADPVSNIDDGAFNTFWGTTKQEVTPKTITVNTKTGPEPKIIHVLAAPGVDQTVKLVYQSSVLLRGWSIIVGDQTTGATSFKDSQLPENIELIFSSGQPDFFTLKNVSTPQSFTIAPKQTTFLELKVLTVYPGSKAKFLAIAELDGFTES